jgi:hypothetical protein
MAVEVLKKIYKPSMTVGQVYARPYGSTAAPMPVGNVLELGLEHTEDVQRQDDMTVLGGGTHAEVRRVTEVKVKMKLADLNVVNLARASLGTVAGIEAGTTSEVHTAALGGLLPLGHIAPTAVAITKPGGTADVADEQHAGVNKGDLVALTHAAPSAVTVKVGADLGTATTVAASGNYTVQAAGIQVLADAADIADASTLWVSYTYSTGTVVPMAGNYLVLAEGIRVLENAADIQAGDALTVSYSYGAYAAIEALTTKAPELELLFGGLNEADSGNPVVVNVWRASQGVTKALSLINKGFGALDVEGSVLQDPTKTGAGISKYYRTRMA